jgi:hypothetical protein
VTALIDLAISDEQVTQLAQELRLRIGWNISLGEAATVTQALLMSLTAHGLLLPPGVTIGAVYRVVRHGMDDGYLFTDRREAKDWARDGGQDGTAGEVHTAWRIRADGVDVTTTWGRADG